MSTCAPPMPQSEQMVKETLQKMFQEMLQQYVEVYKAWLHSDQDQRKNAITMDAITKALGPGAVDLDLQPDFDGQSTAEELLRMGLVCLPSATDSATVFGPHTWRLVYDLQWQRKRYEEVQKDARAQYHKELAARLVAKLRAKMMDVFGPDLVRALWAEFC